MAETATSKNRIQRRMEKSSECAIAFETLVDCTEVEIPSEGILAGPVQLNFEGLEKKLQCPPWEVLGADNQHFAMNMETVLRLGFAGIARQARKNSASLTGEEAGYLEAIAHCYEAAMGFVAAHADEAEVQLVSASGEERQRLERIAHNCRALSEREPRTFSEAVQLSWFAWCIRRCGWGGTIGRLDQHLYPFYKTDLESGRLTREAAFELLCELWEGYNRATRGDTLSNLILGGQDRNGNDATNKMSYLMIDVALAVRKSEPQLSVRIHKNMPQDFLDKIAELQLLGHGQGAIYHDECIIPELVKLGVPLSSARNYANDGCTEVTIDGESGISMAQMEAVKSLELTIFNGQQNPRLDDEEIHTVCKSGFSTGDFSAMTSFEEVYDAFLRQYLYQVDALMNWLCDCIRSEQEDGVSLPFLAGTFPECLKSGRDPFRGGFTVPCQVIFSGSIPTVADGLAAIRQVVFEEKACTPTDLLDALRVDFVGHEPLRRRLLHAPKFGNDDDRVDEIAADIARCFCERVRQHPTPTGKPIWPALYNFTFNNCAKTVGATPDGRRWKDPIAEHYSPTPGRAKSGPTAVIRSACKGPLNEACGAALFHISLSRDVVPQNAQGRTLLKQLLNTALELGVAIMSTAIYDVDMMRDAKLYPVRHEDLVVRVWGYSARFIDLAEDMQDHIIARVISG